ncbi:MAG: hypothetical protein ABJA34_02325 [Pseudonocardiales bacterium]
MTGDIPSGFVDARDPAQVAAVLRSTVDRLGMSGLADLLSRLPVRIDPGQAPGRFSRGRPPRVMAGEQVVVLAQPVVLEHVVGGIVLSRTPARHKDVPDLLAAIVCAAVADSGDAGAASVVITSVRDALGAAG